MKNLKQKPRLLKQDISGNVTCRPILFSTEMVRAILDGRKTQTRRIVKPQPDDDGLWNDTDFPRSLQSELKGWNGVVEKTGESKEFRCIYGKVDDILWVRETFNYEYPSLKPYYKASPETLPDYLKELSEKYGSKHLEWKPSIFMPREACRIELRITNVKVERLQSISEEDARREGVKYDLTLEFNQYLNYEKGIYQCQTAVESFKTLWLEINGEKSWSENPFVWVITFERVELSEHYR